MLLFLKRYLKSLSVITGVMIVYSLTISRWIEPIEQTSSTIPIFDVTSSGNRWWEPLFKPQDWQNLQPTVLRNSRGVLLAKSWEQIDQRTWKLVPLTIVLTLQDREDRPDAGIMAGEDAWVISAPEGATIHFDQPLDLNSGRVPSIERGQLDGAINIYQISMADPGKPTFELRTKNLSIDRRQIWTQDEVSVSTSDLLIEGRNLRIHLISDILSQRSSQPEDDSDSRYGPLDELELMHLSIAKMRLAPGGIWAEVDPKLLLFPQSPLPSTHSPSLSSRSLLEQPAHIEAECGGRFSLNFTKEIATLNSGVRLRHFLGDYPPDEFQCHRVQMKFQFADQQAKPVTNKVQLQGMAIRELEAFGIDSLEDFVGEMWVEVKSPLANASARAKRVRYDFRNQRIELAGKLNQPGATVSVAELNYRGYHLRAPTLEYQAAPQAPDGSRAHGGWLVANGAGEVSTPTDSQIGSLNIRWQDRLQWSPADQPGQQWLEIVGQTLVESRHRGFVTSDRLQLWLSSAATSGAATPETGLQGKLLPKRLVSLGQTSISTAGYEVLVDSADLSFLYPTDNSPDPSSELQLQDSAGNPMFQFLSPPGSQPHESNVIANGGSPTAVRILGKSLAASVVMSETIRIDGLTLQGPLSLKSAQANSAAPIEIAGETLVLATTADGKVDLEIEGQPARVNMGDGGIEGPVIRFNQRSNQVWMDQPGVFTMPASVLGSAAADGMHWQVPPRVSWQGRMLFDGRTVKFDGGIRMNGALQRGDGLWLMEGLCQTLDIGLSEQVEFQRLSSTLQINQVSLRSDVDLRLAQRDSLGQRQSLQRLLVPEVNIFVEEGKVVATGPGRGVAKFLSGNSMGSLASSRKPAEEQLQCSHLTFRDSLTGLMTHNEIVADGNVKVVTSPIATWETDFDPYTLARFAPGQMSIACDQLKMFDAGSLNSSQAARLSSGSSLDQKFWEVQATGNVVFEGNSDSSEFSGNAYQTTYVQSKDLLTVRGDGRSKALLRLTQPSNANRSRPTIFQAPVVNINVKTMAVDAPDGGLDIQVDFQNGEGNNGSIGSEGLTPATSENPAQPPNPRDSIKNFLRGN